MGFLDDWGMTIATGGIAGSNGLLGMLSPDAPPAPDYTGAAQATAAGNADAARINAKANRVSQYTPYGNLIYSNGINGDQDQWRADIQLSPDQQALLDQQNRTSRSLAGLQDQGVNYVSGMMQSPFDQGNLPGQTINAGQTAQDAIMARLNPQMDRRQEALRTQLANQGLNLGSEAYGNAMSDFNQVRNDAEMQAALKGIDVGQQARQQAIQEQSFFRNEPLNTLNALRTGSQVTNPTFTNVPQQQYAAGPNYSQAAQSQGQFDLGNYNVQQSQTNAILGGLFGLGAAGIGG